jgi:hypothetical protein
MCFGGDRDEMPDDTEDHRLADVCVDEALSDDLADWLSGGSSQAGRESFSVLAETS